MRVLSYILLAYVALALNIGLVPWLKLGETRIEFDFVLIVVTFIALFAPAPGAWLGCLIIGFVQDLLSPMPLGFHTLAYGTVGLLGYSLAQSLYRTHPLTQTLTAASGVMVLLFCYLIAGRLHSPAFAGYSSFLLGSLFTVVLTPVLLWPIQTRRKWFLMAKTRRN